MSRFFSLDNKLMTTMSKIADAMFLSVLWFITSIPVITMAASVNALYETIQICLVNDSGKIHSVFLKAFKRSFKTGILHSVIIELPVMCLVVLAIWDSMYSYGYEWIGAAYVFLGIISLASVQTAIYDFMLMRSTDFTSSKQLFASFYLSVKNEPASLLMTAVLFTCCVITDIIPFAAIIVPSFYCWFCSLLLEKTAKKYRGTFKSSSRIMDRKLSPYSTDRLRM